MSRAGQPQPGGPCPRPTMNLEGLEMVAVLVVLALFVKVLESKEPVRSSLALVFVKTLHM